MACFFLYARRSNSNPEEAVLHLICLTEPERADHLLELREDFVEVMRTDYVEIYDKNEVSVREEHHRTCCSSSLIHRIFKAEKLVDCDIAVHSN